MVSPEACDLREFMVVASAISNANNMQDDHSIAVFEESEWLKSGMPLQSHLTLIDGPCRPVIGFSVCISNGALLSVYSVVTLQKIADQEKNFSWMNSGYTITRSIL